MSRRKNDKDDVRQDIKLYIDVLVDLYEKTDPAKGRRTEAEKLARARHAIEVWWRLYDRLMHWAQSQLVGYVLARSDPKLLEILPHLGRDEITEDSHELEYLGQGYGWNPNRTDERYQEKLEKLHERLPGLDETALRALIVELLVSRSANSSFWRFELQTALRALNEGEIDPLFQPEQKRKQGAPFQLIRAKLSVVSQVRFRIGQGTKKHRALEDVANAIGQSPETLRDWEKALLKDEDYEFDLICSKLAGQLLVEFDRYRDDELERKFGAIWHRGTSSIEYARWLLPQLQKDDLSHLREQIRRHRVKSAKKSGGRGAR